MRLFAYGSFAVVLGFFLSSLGLSASQKGMLLAPTLAGSFATATGSLCGGMLSLLLQRTAMTPVGSYRVVVLLYAALGVVLVFLFTRLSPAAEVSSPGAGSGAPVALKTLFGIGHSRDVVLKLSGLFALDSFAGGFVVQSFAAYWFYLRFAVRSEER